jgi:hypothetical protein
MSRLHAFVSELAATGEPYRQLFATTDSVAGLLLIAAGSLLLTRPALFTASTAPRALLRVPLPRAAWIALIVSGLFTLLDVAVFPMDCAPSANAACKAAEEAGTVSIIHQIHTVTSSVVGGALLIAMAASTVIPPRARWTLVTLTGAALLATLVLLPTGQWFGAAQRVQVALVAVWLVVLAATLVRRVSSATIRTSNV